MNVYFGGYFGVVLVDSRSRRKLTTEFTEDTERPELKIFVHSWLVRFRFAYFAAKAVFTAEAAKLKTQMAERQKGEM